MNPSNSASETGNAAVLDLGAFSVPRQPVPPGLHLVATPIGRLSDITIQALHVLAAADPILCEDTRVSAKLLQHYGLDKVRDGALWAYHDHNAAEQRPKVLDRLRNGATIAMISDAGTPLVSDPGYKLVREVVEAGLPVTTAPGASSVLTALQLSALPTDRFIFIGFPPPRSAGRKRAFSEWRDASASLVVFETAKRMTSVLADAVDVFGPRPATLTRELTKRHEEAVRGTLPDLAERAANGGLTLRGECVLVIGPADKAMTADQTDIDAALRDAMAQYSVKDAVRLVSGAHGLERRAVYARALALRDGLGVDG
ncbi:MAG: 16S rRNA (cytidine(1402)-2'-O)-methyltransferase [Alphaproteobacteria bacterium]|nr:16S rRNA (cytidine(1402)-2'-O)-methyltransferase [Alphaproteobacteria bacterium SS10]